MYRPQFDIPSTVTYDCDDGTEKIFEVHEELGHGGFAVVYRVTLQNTNKSFAMKVISKERYARSQSNISFDKLKNEIQIQKSLNHPNIVQYKYSFSDDFYYYIVLEYCPGKSVRDLLQQKEEGHLTEPETRKILNDVIQGLIYIQNNQIIHHDLKLDNFLIGSDGEVKIADFGLATDMQYLNQRQCSVCGTTNYLSPELLRFGGSSCHGFEVDIWAIGVATFIMLTGRPPFDGGTKEMTFENIKKCIYHFPSKSGLSYDAKDFIESIFQVDIRLRATAIDLVDHPFLTNSDDSEKVQLYEKPVKKVKKMMPIRPLKLTSTTHNANNYNNNNNNNNNNKIRPNINTINNNNNNNNNKIRPNINTINNNNNNNNNNKIRPNINTINYNNNNNNNNKIRPNINTINHNNNNNSNNNNKIKPNISTNNNNRISLRCNIKSRASSVNSKKPAFDFSPNNGYCQIQFSSTNFSVLKYIVTSYYFHNDDVGYLLGDGTVGACFKDFSRIVLDPNEEFVQYYKDYESRAEVIKVLMNSNNKHRRKISFVQRLAKTFKKIKSLYEIKQTYFDPSLTLYNVKYFVKKGESALFKFNDKNIQVNFIDNKKMIIFMNLNKMCIFSDINEKCDLLDTKIVAGMNPNSDIRRKFLIAKEMLDLLYNKLKSAI